MRVCNGSFAENMKQATLLWSEGVLYSFVEENMAIMCWKPLHCSAYSLRRVISSIISCIKIISESKGFELQVCYRKIKKKTAEKGKYLK